MKNIKIKIAALTFAALIVTITGCKVSKDVTAPANAIPASYRYAENDSSSIAKIAWKQFYNNEELSQLIDQALEHNNDLQVALKDIEAAELSLKQAKLGNLPNIGVQATAVTNRPSDNSLNGLSLAAFGVNSKHIEDYTIAASLSWEADIWGKIRSRKAVALADYLRSAEARKLIQTRIVADVAKGYYNLLMLDTELDIARQNVRLNDSTLQIIQLQYNAGQVTSLAIQQAQAQKLAAERLIPDFEKQISIQENALSILSGVNPGAISRKNNLYAIPVGNQFGVGLPAQLLSSRPDVRISEIALSRANGEVGYAKASLYPSLTITAQGGLDAIKASNWFNIPASLFGTVAGSITQPIFQQKRLRTLYEIAKVNRDASVIRFRQSVLVAVGEVSDNLVKIEQLEKQGDLADARVKTLQLAIRNSQMLFGNGLATYLEVITAQGNVLQSQLETAGLRKDRLDAQVDLYRSLGGGWQ
jgi:multidrug efflux system outer membrane protein